MMTSILDKTVLHGEHGIQAGNGKNIQLLLCSLQSRSFLPFFVASRSFRFSNSLSLSPIFLLLYVLSSAAPVLSFSCSCPCFMLMLTLAIIAF